MKVAIPPLHEVRCPNHGCQRLLLLWDGSESTVAVRCRRCKVELVLRLDRVKGTMVLDQRYYHG